MKYKHILLITIILFSGLRAAVDLSISAASSMERNSVYEFTVAMNNLSSGLAIGVFEARVTYNKDVFEILSMISLVQPESLWQIYRTMPIYDNTAEPYSFYFLRSNTQGSGYSLPAGASNMLRVQVRIKDDAPLGDTTLGFVDTATFVGAVTGAKTGKAVTIQEDTTAPTTITTFSNGNYYKNNFTFNLNTNEELHKATINYTIQRTDLSDVVNSGADPLSNIQAAGIVDDVITVTLNYYAEDWAGDAVSLPSHNIEGTKTVSAIIDQELPGISNTAIQAPDPIGPGGTITVNFTIYDKSGVLAASNPIQVNVGGNQVQVTAQGANNTSYAVTKTIVGNESNRNVVITVTDRSGNTSTVTLTNALTYDFAGPEFIIDAVPNPLYMAEELLITVSASEALQNSPNVQVGPNTANYRAKVSGQDIYVYSFTPTTNGWGAGFAWLNGAAEPYIADYLAGESSTGNPVNQVIHFRVAHYYDDIDLATLVVTVDGQAAIIGGVVQPGFVGRIARLVTKSYDVFVAPVSNYISGAFITVNISVKDTSASQDVLTKVFDFQVGGELDTTTPSVLETYPVNNARNIPADKAVYIHLSDPMSGIAADRINVTLNIYSGVVSNAGVNAAAELLTQNMAIQNGMFLPGYSGSIVFDEDKGYQITIASNAGFPIGSTVKVEISFNDLAIIENSSQAEFTFTIMSTNDGSTGTARLFEEPLAYPTIFNPSIQNTRLYFELKEAGDAELRIYDLGGSLVHKQGFVGIAGRQYLDWDGSGDSISNLGNGIYFFYIVEGKKVQARGKVFIMRENAKD